MTLNAEIKLLQSKLDQLVNQIKDMAEHLNDKTPVPYSKVGFDRYLGNADVVFDGNSGLFKTYAVYKDEPED